MLNMQEMPIRSPTRGCNGNNSMPQQLATGISTMNKNIPLVS